MRHSSSSKLSLREKIEYAFLERQRPRAVADTRDPVTPEQHDALWFDSRDWREITWDEWEVHRDAFYAFTPEAFAYYLPSILVLSAQTPDRWFWPADALLQVLDRSPVVEYWDEFLTTRLLGLRPLEYEALTEWLLCLSEHSATGSEGALERAFDTINLLQKMAEQGQ